MRTFSRHRAGFVLPFLLLTSLSVILYLGFVSTMSSQYVNQIAHLDELTRTRAIGEAVYAQVVARLRAKPWPERFFAARPFVEEDVSYLDGSYDLMVRDASRTGKGECLVDVFVQARFGRVSRLYFWRFRHEFSLLDAGGKAFPVLFATLSSGSESISQAGDTFSPVVSSILKEREKNKDAIQQLGGMLQTTPSLPNVLNIVNVPSAQPVQDPRPAGPQVVAAPPPLPKDLPVPPPKKTWGFPSHPTTTSQSSGNPQPTGSGGGARSDPEPAPPMTTPPGWEFGSGLSVPEPPSDEDSYGTGSTDDSGSDTSGESSGETGGDTGSTGGDASGGADAPADTGSSEEEEPDCYDDPADDCSGYDDGSASGDGSGEGSGSSDGSEGAGGEGEFGGGGDFGGETDGSDSGGETGDSGATNGDFGGETDNPASPGGDSAGDDSSSASEGGTGGTD